LCFIRWQKRTYFGALNIQNMKKLRLMLGFAIIAFSAIQLTSCGDDDPTYSFPSANIDDEEYTMGGTVRILYSTDGGANFTETVPSGIGNGAIVKAKLNNGTVDLTTADFEFDWSGSVPAPSNATSDVAEFTVGSDVVINVKGEDKWSLITSHRTSGKVFIVDKATGAKTESFTPMFNANALTSLRGFVYHKNQKKFYVTQNTDAGGDLYTIDPATKVATRINDNLGSADNEIWDAVVNWAVAADDSLIGIGDFNDDGNGIVKFGTNGGRSKKTAQADICCALGMLYDASAQKFTIANAWATEDKQVLIEDYTHTGALSGSPIEITTFNGFPDDLATYWLNVRSMAKDKDGVIYGNMFSDDNKKTYFVKIDLTAKTITYVAVIGADAANQHNVLVFVPTYTL
jgi:hypothetical protein